MKDSDCVRFLQDVLPEMQMQWPGFRKVRRQVCKRINRRIGELGLADLGQYRAYLDCYPDEWQVLDRACRIPISRFYRDLDVFELLRGEILPLLAQSAPVQSMRRIRVWSAGCASGEEPYTLRMIWDIELQSRFPGISLEILATDADQQMLQRAHVACFAPSSIKDFPAAWTTTGFRKQGEQFFVRDSFREGIRFELQDIRDGQPDGPFHMILCRHLVFTYFSDQLQREILPNLLNRLDADGFLVIGKKETLPENASDRRTTNFPLDLLRVNSGIYRRKSSEK